MVKPTRHMSVVIPGLFGPPGIKRLPEAWQDLSLPALEEILTRARRETSAGNGLEHSLFALFNTETRHDADVPVAAVTRQWEAQDADGYWWLRADPVHMRADRDSIVMLGNEALDISHEECREIALELNRHFGGEYWFLDAANARRWYLRLGEDPHITTAALSEVLGRNILPAMPQGPAAGRWRSMMNEVQMVLHSSAVNQSREARGALAVNSLWFWGGGRLPGPAATNWSHVWSNDALSQGLASLMDIPRSSLPPEAAEWLDDDTPGEHLLVMDGMRDKVQLGSVEGWREFMQAWHDAWLAPLLVALKGRRLATLRLYPADGTVFELGTRDARRWWVRRRSLSQWL